MEWGEVKEGGEKGEKVEEEGGKERGRWEEWVEGGKKLGKGGGGLGSGQDETWQRRYFPPRHNNEPLRGYSKSSPTIA